MKVVIIGCVLAAMVAGCTTTSGVRVQQSQLAGFQKGVTTDTEVISALGAPAMSSVTSDGNRVLVYSFAEYKIRGSTFIPVVGLFSGGSDLHANSAVFTFGSDRKLISYTASESNFSSGTAPGSTTPGQAQR